MRLKPFALATFVMVSVGLADARSLIAGLRPSKDFLTINGIDQTNQQTKKPKIEENASAKAKALHEQGKKAFNSQVYDAAIERFRHLTSRRAARS